MWIFVSSFFLFVIYWWLAFLICLPWGVRSDPTPQVGHASGAPLNSRLRRKVWIAALIALILVGVTHFGVSQRLIRLDMMYEI